MVFLQLIVQKFSLQDLIVGKHLPPKFFRRNLNLIISGSSTSTGSFGVLKLDGGEFTSDHYASGG